jgi:hypothetical protein
MNEEKYVIVTDSDEILAIVKNKDTAEFFLRFTMKASAKPISYWDFNYEPIREFMRA